MRIKNLEESDFDTLIGSVALRYRVQCDEMNVILIKQTLQSEFQHYQINDFNEAFIKHCAGKFMISKDQEGNKPYGDLSALFVCSVLNSFKTFKAKKHKVLPIPLKSETDVSKLIEKPILTKDQNAEKWFDWMEEETKKNNSVPLIADWSAIYWYLDKQNLINLDVNEKEMFFENVKFEIQEEILFRKAEKRDYLRYSRMIESDGGLILECRKRLVIKHFEQKLNK